MLLNPFGTYRIDTSLNETEFIRQLSIIGNIDNKSWREEKKYQFKINEISKLVKIHINAWRSYEGGASNMFIKYDNINLGYIELVIKPSFKVLFFVSIPVLYIFLGDNFGFKTITFMLFLFGLTYWVILSMIKYDKNILIKNMALPN